MRGKCFYSSSISSSLSMKPTKKVTETWFWLGLKDWAMRYHIYIYICPQRLITLGSPEFSQRTHSLG